MLKMGRKFTINRDDCPSIFLDFRLVAALIDHRLQCAIVSPGRSNMPCPACPKFSKLKPSCNSRPTPWLVYSRTTLKPCGSAARLDRGANIAGAVAGAGRRNGSRQAILRHLHQLLCLRAHPAHTGP